MNQFQKPIKIRSKKITNSAKGEQCTLHTAYCVGGTETTVFCHAPSEGKGMGTKSDDFWGAYGCAGCHKFLDLSRMDKHTREIWYRGIFRTQKRLFEKGLIKIKG